MKPPTRRFFIGDIHGCLFEVLDLLDSFNFRQDHDRLFCVGDVIGKGPYSVKCLQALEDRQARIVLGNHEHAALQYSLEKRNALSDENRALLDSLGPLKKKWLEKISTWPLYMEMPDVILVHAGLEPGVSRLEKMNQSVLINVRYWPVDNSNHPADSKRPWYDFINTSKTIIFGHWASQGLVDKPRFKGLDTGCVYGGSLTGFCPEENRFYSVKSKKAYAPIVPMKSEW
jgi:bis(5'-nucleosyl)-tetraphosphatase (symmetrical)